MTLWRLEWVRLMRTGRVMILIAVFFAMGLLGPLSVRYLPELLESAGGDPASISTLPPVTAEFSMAAFLSNAIQLGLLAVAFVGAAALAIDAKPEISVYFRSRASIPQILAPRYVFNAGATVIAFAFGVVTAVVATGVLIEWPPAADTVVASLLVVVYLVFVVALIALFGSLVRRVPATALLTIGSLIALSIIGLYQPVEEYLPSHLVGGFETVIAGGDFTYWPAIIVTLILTAACLSIARIRLEQREV
jgi:ABC-2 type transport system permease protein